MNDGQPLFDAASIRRIERVAMAEPSSPGETLMERAGAAAFRQLRARWPAVRSVAVIAGPGNNGGDGFVLARLAASAGIATRDAIVGDPERYPDDAATALHRMRRESGVTEAAPEQVLDGADAIVDSLFGIGLTRNLEGPFAAAVHSINAAGIPVLAIDVPSGLDADTGAVHGDAVRASCTVTFIARKRGMYTGRAREFTGEICCESIGLEDLTAPAGESASRLVGCADFAGVLGPRARAAHKGRFGHVLVVGGNLGFGGAARLTGEAAARCGAGLVTIATRSEHVAPTLATRPELMIRGVEAAADLEDLPGQVDVIALGPGLGKCEWAVALGARALAAGRPCVIDADALNLLAAGEVDWPAASTPCIFTPHPGEAARLLDVSVAEVERDRFSASVRLASLHPGTWILKGAGTLVASAGQPVMVCSGGNPGMASGGMGDVLTGVAASLVAQGLSPLGRAAAAAVCLHAAAADEAAAEGERGLLAGDLMPPLRRLVEML